MIMVVAPVVVVNGPRWVDLDYMVSDAKPPHRGPSQDGGAARQCAGLTANGAPLYSLSG